MWLEKGRERRLTRWLTHLLHFYNKTLLALTPMPPSEWSEALSDSHPSRISSKAKMDNEWDWQSLKKTWAEDVRRKCGSRMAFDRHHNHYVAHVPVSWLDIFSTVHFSSTVWLCVFDSLTSLTVLFIFFISPSNVSLISFFFPSLFVDLAIWIRTDRDKPKAKKRKSLKSQCCLFIENKLFFILLLLYVSLSLVCPLTLARWQWDDDWCWCGW